MTRALSMLKYLLGFLGAAILLISCSGGSDSSNGTLGVGITDATTDLYEAIYITIDEVHVKKQGADEGEASWIVALTPGKTLNLLELVNGMIADLGMTELEAGQYDQVRLILGKQIDDADDSVNLLGETHSYPNYLIKNDGASTIEELTVPSGLQTGIKIVHGFDIATNGATELILDFDAIKSIVQAGNSGKWLLKPTIKVLDTEYYAMVSGDVNNGGDSPAQEPLAGSSMPPLPPPPPDELDSVDPNNEGTYDPVEGVLVSAQIYTPPPEQLDGWDPKNEVANEGGTVSDAFGSYVLKILPNTYNIVATMPGYATQCQVVAATDNQDYPGNDFNLSALTEENLGSITVSVSGEKIVEFSIRQTKDCGSGNAKIEVASISVSGGATSDPITLPIGTYEVVVSPEGGKSYSVDGGIDVVAGENINVTYTPSL